MTNDLQSKLKTALTQRAELLERLHGEDTNAYRVFHGVAEGRQGLTVDRYGPVLLAQTFRDPLTDDELAALNALAEQLELQLVWNHRGKKKGQSWSDFHDVSPVAGPIALEAGLSYDARPRHRGIDPLLFLDFRQARKRVRAHAQGKRVLNLFSYTCGIGLAAAAGGAEHVLNVDFATSSLDVGRENATRNDLSQQDYLHEDVFPVIRQLAGLSLPGRPGRRPRFQRMEAEQFDLVVLDPPRYARSKWGVVDLIRDYSALFKPALLATAPGGHMLVTNNVAKVPLEEWQSVLERAAKKAGRTIQSAAYFGPESDFPSTDGRPPLKQAWLHVE